MPNSELVSLPVDAEGKVEAVSNPAWSTEYAKGYNAALAALREAVVVGAGDANDLAFLISRETDVLPDTAWHAANALLAAGYRKTVILNHSRLIEEIAKIQGRNDAHEIDCGDAVPCRLCLDRATALLARVEDDR